MRNRRVVLRSRPAHVPDRENFGVVEVDVPEPGPDGALVRNLYISVEAAVREGQYFELVTMSVDGNPAVLAHVL